MNWQFRMYSRVIYLGGSQEDSALIIKVIAVQR